MGNPHNSRLEFYYFFTDNLWMDRHSFLWNQRLDHPLYRCVITPSSEGHAASITKEVIFNKAGHCRLATYQTPEGDNNTAYSGKYYFYYNYN